jgi:hypothetical protein
MKVNRSFFTLLIISIIILTSNHKLFSQPKYIKGHVITLKGDTLKGEIEVNPKKELDCYKKVKFRAGKAGAIKNFTPEKIKQYRLDTTTFVSTVVDDEPVFVKRLLAGTLNVYEGRSELSEGLPDYFFEKDGKIIVIQDKPKQFKKQLIPVMSDNAEIVKAIETEKYNFDSLLELFKAYNK